MTALVPVSVKAQEPTDVFRQRAQDVLTLFQGSEKEEEIFAPSFLEAIPLTQIRSLENQLVTQYGPAQSISVITPISAYEGAIEYQFEKAVIGVSLVIAADPPHRITGLLLTGALTKDDSYTKLKAEFSQLSGHAGFQVARLDDDGISRIDGRDDDTRFAIGSTFKLYILAALDHAVKAGDRTWSDVVTLGPKSHPSGITQDWLDDTPVTLQTLATLMISVSDNSATDTLIRVLGQDRLAEAVRTSGHSHPRDMLPLLMTQQVSALKMSARGDVRTAFLAATEDRQAAIIRDNAKRLTLADIDLSALAGKPQHIETIEWFASPADIARLMNHLRLHASAVARGIMAINPGIGRGDAKRWKYLGYKGGSEAGVISLNWLAQKQDGTWVAVTGSWNDPDKPVSTEIFLSLMTRVLNLAAKQSPAAQ